MNFNKYALLLPFSQDRQSLFDKITKEDCTIKKVLNHFMLLMLLSLIYGILMGSYHSLLQAITSGFKMIILFSLSLLICFPAFFIIQAVLGSKLRLFQMMTIVLAGFILTTSIMVSFSPIILFFQITGGNYYFLILLHLSVLALSTYFGFKTIINALQYSCEKKNVYPKTGVTIFRFWIIILAFVGIQLAWNLRPFLGKRTEPYQLFRKYEGNFYTAIIYSLDQLIGTKKPEQTREKNSPNQGMEQDTLLHELLIHNK